MKTTKKILNAKIFLLPLFTSLVISFASAQTNNALGNNMKVIDSVLVGSSMEYIFAVYSGDMNQDGNVDMLDFPLWDYDNSIFNYGYLLGDLNGDANVDLLDFPLWDVNNANYVYSQRPY